MFLLPFLLHLLKSVMGKQRFSWFICVLFCGNAQQSWNAGLCWWLSLELYFTGWMCVWQTVMLPSQDENTRRCFILCKRGFIHGYQGQHFSYCGSVFLFAASLFSTVKEVCVILSDTIIKAEHNRIIFLNLIWFEWNYNYGFRTVGNLIDSLIKTRLPKNLDQFC